MADYETVCILLFLICAALMLCALMLSGIRDSLCNIDYELATRNLADLYRHAALRDEDAL